MTGRGGSLTLYPVPPPLPSCGTEGGEHLGPQGKCWCLGQVECVEQGPHKAEGSGEGTGQGQKQPCRADLPSLCQVRLSSLWESCVPRQCRSWPSLPDHKATDTPEEWRGARDSVTLTGHGLRGNCALPRAWLQSRECWGQRAGGSGAAGEVAASDKTLVGQA